MKKIALAGLIVVAVTVMLVPPSEATGRRFHHGGRVRTSVFIGFGPAYYPYYYYPYYYYPYYYYPYYYPYYPRPITTYVTPFFEGGAVGQPVPFTQWVW